jgi:hypothetical protein
MRGIIRKPPPIPAKEPHNPAIVPIIKDFGIIVLSGDDVDVGFFGILGELDECHRSNDFL